MKTILHLCADIGSDTLPYKKAGYNVITVGKDIGVENYEPPDNVYGIIANPVCTEFSIARSYGFKGDYEKGMVLVNACLDIINKCEPVFWVIENPATGKLKNFLGKPDFTYHPWNFGDPWTKHTALWGNFNAPKKIYSHKHEVEANPSLYVRPGKSFPGMYQLHKSAIKNIPAFDGIEVEDDMSFRSLCPQGFANAFFAVNL